MVELLNNLTKRHLTSTNFFFQTLSFLIGSLLSVIKNMLRIDHKSQMSFSFLTSIIISYPFMHGL